MADPLIPIKTIRYKTYVKEALVEALTSVFNIHPDTITLEGLKVTTDLPTDRQEYPAIVVRFYERSLKNMGVGHQEYLNLDGSTAYRRYKHVIYKGDIEFAVYALTSYDRDIVSDALNQILMMADVATYTQGFLNRIYGPNPGVEPESAEHYINLNTDEVQGFGETQQIAPWMPEDVLVYQVSYRIAIMGELYSPVPTDPGTWGLVEGVNVYPYNPTLGEAVPDPEPDNPNPWVGGGPSSE